MIARATILTVLLASPAMAEDIIGRASVIDGDTIEIHGRRIRLQGIDAPETRQSCTKTNGEPWRCGVQASIALSDYLGASAITCSTLSNDRYGRALATCTKAGDDIGQWLVASGHAVAYRRYSAAYVKDESIARDAGIGIWAGTFETPEEYRRSARRGGR
jgi:endonuclease YncB( thermonuclease family)